VRVTFDRRANAAYIYLVPIGAGEAVRTVPVDADRLEGFINLDFDEHGRLLGIEVLNATRLLPAGVLDHAERL
jgi:uncharacterized protein YuzE